MADESGGQLIIDGLSGEFEIVRDAWFPLEDALTPLWFGNNLEGDDTKVGPGDYIINPTYWAQTRHQIPMWFMGHIDGDGATYDNVMEGFASNVNYWRNEILDPSVSAREATLQIPGQADRYALVSKLELTGTGRRRPSGWPLTFSFLLPNGPFTESGGS